MTDRAKKISELQATTTVANTDKLVVLKDPSGTPSTRSVTVNALATSIISGYIANSYAPNIGINGNIEIKAKQSNTAAQGGTLLLKAGSSNTGTGGYVEIWSGNGVSGADITLKTWSGSEWLSWSFGADGNFYFPDGSSQDTAHIPAPVTVVTDTVYIATVSDEILFCDPGTAGGDITVNLPNTNIANGKNYIIKNINAASYSVFVQLVDLSTKIENPSSIGTLISQAELSTNGSCAEWVYGAGAYRLVSSIS